MNNNNITSNLKPPLNIHNTNILNNQNDIQNRDIRSLMFSEQDPCPCSSCLKTKSIKRLQSLQLDLDFLMEKKYSHVELVKFAKKILGGEIPSLHLCFGELFIPKMHASLEELKSTFSLNIQKHKKNSLLSEKESIKKHTNSCKTALLHLRDAIQKLANFSTRKQTIQQLLNRLESTPEKADEIAVALKKSLETLPFSIYKIAHTELIKIEKNSKQYIKNPCSETLLQLKDNYNYLNKKLLVLFNLEINTLETKWKTLKHCSVECLAFINKSSYVPKKEMGSYIEFLNFLETLCEEKNKKTILSWLYEPIRISMKPFISFSKTEHIGLILKQIECSQKFSHQTLSYYLESLEDIHHQWSSKEKKAIEPPSYVMESLSLFILKMQEHRNLLEQFNFFSSESAFAKDLLLFFNSFSSHPQFFDLYEFKDIEQKINTWQLYASDLEKNLKNHEQIKKSRNPVLLFLEKTKINKDQPEIYLNHFSTPLDVLKEMDLFHHTIYLPLSLMKHLINLAKEGLSYWNCSRQIAQKVNPNKEVFLNNAYSFLSPTLKFLNSFKDPRLALLKHALIKCIGVASIELSSCENTKEAARIQYYFKAMPLIIQQTSLHFTETPISEKLKELNEHFQLYVPFINKGSLIPILFFNQRKKEWEFTDKESEELKSFLFPLLNEHMAHPFSNLVEDVEKNIEFLVEHCSSQLIPILNGYLQLQINYWLKIEHLAAKLILLLKPNEAPHWEITQDNLTPINNILTQLEFLKKRMPQFNFSLQKILSDLNEEEKEKIKKIDASLQIITPLCFFLCTTLPFVENWFRKTKEEFKTKTSQVKKKQISPHKKKTSSIKTENLSIKPSHVPFIKENEKSPPYTDKKKISSVTSEQRNSSKSITSFKVVHHKKKSVQGNNPKPLAFWEDAAHQTEICYENFLIFKLSSNLEGYWSLFQRYIELEKSRLHIHFHLWMLNQASKVTQEKIPHIFSRIFQQRWPLIAECSVKGILLTQPICAKNSDKIHILWQRDDHNRLLLYSHDGTTLYSLLDKEITEKTYPEEIAAMQEQLNHSYIGSKPRNSLLNLDKQQLLLRAIQLIKKALDKQKTIHGPILSKEDIIGMQLNSINTLHQTVYWLPHSQNISLNPYQIEKEKIFNWMETIKISTLPIQYAKKRILYAFQLQEELMHPKIKEETPTLYCCTLADINNMLMSNFLHLYLAIKEKLDPEKRIDNRPITHCHNPLKLWKFLLENNLVEKNQSRMRCMERCCIDSRYIFAKSCSSERELTQIFEIDMAFNSSRHFEKQSQRIQNLIEKHNEEGEKNITTLVLNFEIDLSKCLQVIADMISEL